MIKGTGQLITDTDEKGDPIPFLTTDQILQQIMKFGFYVTYNEVSNLPDNVIEFLSTIDNLGYDKITRIYVKEIDKTKAVSWRPKVIVMKSEENTDILNFGARITSAKFFEKLQANSIMNVSEEPDMAWDWVTYIANISDILDENLDEPDEYRNNTGVQEGVEPLAPEGFTPYVDPDDTYPDPQEGEDGP